MYINCIYIFPSFLLPFFLESLSTNVLGMEGIHSLLWYPSCFSPVPYLAHAFVPVSLELLSPFGGHSMSPV